MSANREVIDGLVRNEVVQVKKRVRLVQADIDERDNVVTRFRKSSVGSQSEFIVGNFLVGQGFAIFEIVFYKYS